MSCYSDNLRHSPHSSASSPPMGQEHIDYNQGLPEVYPNLSLIGLMQRSSGNTDRIMNQRYHLHRHNFLQDRHALLADVSILNPSTMSPQSIQSDKKAIIGDILERALMVSSPLGPAVAYENDAEQ